MRAFRRNSSVLAVVSTRRRDGRESKPLDYDWSGPDRVVLTTSTVTAIEARNGEAKTAEPASPHITAIIATAPRASPRPRVVACRATTPRERRLGDRRHARRGALGDNRSVERDGLGLALQRDGLALRERGLGCLRQQASRVLADEDDVPGDACRRLDPRGDVDGVADHRELEAAGAADVPHDHRAGVQTDADRQRAGELVVDGALDL